jgi:hypothetical protein
LAKRALESIILGSSNSNSTCLPFTCFASNMLKNLSSLWFLCKHVDNFCATCDNHAHMILNIDALCVATYMWNDFYLFYFVCNHIAILVMTCHMCYRFEFIGVCDAPKSAPCELQQSRHNSHDVSLEMHHQAKYACHNIHIIPVESR